MKRKFSLANIPHASEEDLGLAEFCFLVAEILLEQFPNATLYRLTDPQRKAFAHVFLSVEGKYLDIMGYGDVVGRFKNRTNCYGLIAEEIEPQKLREHFYPCYKGQEDKAALCAARDKLQRYIHLNPRFCRLDMKIPGP